LSLVTLSLLAVFGTVEFTGAPCEAVDFDRLALATGALSPQAKIAFRCVDGQSILRVERAGAETIERSIVLEGATPEDRERLLSLLIHEALDLTPVAEPRKPRPRSNWTLGASGNLLLAVDPLMLAGGFSLFSRINFSRWVASLDLSALFFSRGSALGTVEQQHYALAVSAGFSHRFWRLTLSEGLGARMAVAQTQGRATDSQTEGRTFTQVWGGPLAFARLSLWASDALSIEVGIEAGWAVVPAVATALDGDAIIQRFGVGGAWVIGSVGLGFRLPN
jgi:hypothetical protein